MTKKCTIGSLVVKPVFGRGVVYATLWTTDEPKRPIIAQQPLAEMLEKCNAQTGFEIINTEEVLKWLVLTARYGA